MRIRQRIIKYSVGLFILLLFSCSTTVDYLPISPDDILIGSVQISFITRDTWLLKSKTINTQVYNKLMEAAIQKYTGDIDIRDIWWVTGRKINSRDIEVSATAKVIRLGSGDKE